MAASYGKNNQEWLHEVDLSYHILGLRHALLTGADLGQDPTPKGGPQRGGGLWAPEAPEILF